MWGIASIICHLVNILLLCRLARLSNIREEIVKEDKELCKLEDNPSDIPEHTIRTYVKPRKCYSENHESDNFEIGKYSQKS